MVAISIVGQERRSSRFSGSNKRKQRGEKEKKRENISELKPLKRSPQEKKEIAKVCGKVFDPDCNATAEQWCERKKRKW